VQSRKVRRVGWGFAKPEIIYHPKIETRKNAPVSGLSQRFDEGRRNRNQHVDWEGV
jgi:hypothetical protein